MKKHLLFWALLPLIVTAQSTQRIEADNILLQTRTPQISNTNVTVNGSMKITAVANGSSTDSVLVVANGTLKRIARSAFTDFVSKTVRDTIVAPKNFTRYVLIDSLYGKTFNLIHTGSMFDQLGFRPPSSGIVSPYLKAFASDNGTQRVRTFRLPSSINDDTLLCQGDSNIYATKSDISGLATTSSVNTALALKQNTLTLTTTGSGAATLNSSTGALNIPVSSGGVTTGTYAQMLAIASPTEGQQFICTDYIPGLWVYTSFGAQWQCQVPPLVNAYTGIFSTSGTHPLTQSLSGSGTAANVVVNDAGATIGSCIEYLTGSTTTGSASIGFNPFAVPLGFRYGFNSAQAIVFRSYVKLGQLSTSAESFYSFIGTRNPLSSMNVCSFIYSHDLNGGNWTARTRGTSSFPANDINTNIAADLNWHEFAIQLNNSFAKFYIDGVLVATSTTNIPNIGSSVNAAIDGISIVKRAGTTAVKQRVDYLKIYNYNKN